MTILDFITENKIRCIDSISRFNGDATIKPESVSQHSWWVVMFTSIIQDELFKYVNKTNSSEILTKTLAFKVTTMNMAINHDFSDEIHSGDILHQVKHDPNVGSDIVESLEKFVRHEQEAMLKRLNTGYDSVACNNMILGENERYGYNSMLSSNLSHAVVKVADWMACLKAINAELQLGNSNYKEIFVRAKDKTSTAITKLSDFYKDYCLDNRISPNNEFMESLSHNLNFLTLNIH